MFSKSLMKMVQVRL